jgi:hypothetical protein
VCFPLPRRPNRPRRSPAAGQITRASRRPRSSPRAPFDGPSPRAARAPPADRARLPAYGDYDRDYAFVNVYNGVASSTSGGLTDSGRLVDSVGGQGLTWNQPLGSSVDVFGYPAGAHPDGKRPCTGESLESSSGSTTAAMVPGLKAEELTAAGSPFTGEGALGSSWLLHYDKSSRLGRLNGIAVSVADADGDLRYDTSLSPYFDGELSEIYRAAAITWSGSILPA